VTEPPDAERGLSRAPPPTPGLPSDRRPTRRSLTLRDATTRYPGFHAVIRIR